MVSAQSLQTLALYIEPDYIRATHAQGVSLLIDTEISLRAPHCRPQ